MQEWTNLIGKVLAGTYRVGELIGQGGMGAVFEAANIRTDKLFAIKVLSGDTGNEELLKRFRREAMIASDLGHPHIVYTVDFNQTEDGISYIVMEHLQGESLADLLKRERSVPLQRAVSIACQVCSALYAVHGKQIIHRDLKPANIFLCVNQESEDFIKVLDFGISKILGPKDLVTLETKENTVLGTPHYMAPEQAEGKISAVGPWTDVYSLGAIVYQMVCGQLAFDGDSLVSLFYKVANHDPPKPSSLKAGIPPQLDAVLAMAMAKECGERYQDMAEFAADLREAAQLPLPENGSLDRTLPSGVQAAGVPVPRGGSSPDAALETPTTLSSTSAEILDEETGPPAPGGRRGKIKMLFSGAAGFVLTCSVVAYLLSAAPAAHPPAHRPELAAAAVPRPDVGPPAPDQATPPPRPARVKLIVMCHPAGARVEVADQVQTTCPASFELPMSTKPVKVQVSAMGHQTGQSTWVPEKDSELQFKLTRHRRKPVRKKLFSKPSFAD